MERRTTIGVAAGMTLTIAAIAVAVGLNVAIMSDRSATTGPGTFEPVAETGAPAGSSANPTPASGPAVETAPAPASTPTGEMTPPTAISTSPAPTSSVRHDDDQREGHDEGHHEEDEDGDDD